MTLREDLGVGRAERARDAHVDRADLRDALVHDDHAGEERGVEQDHGLRDLADAEVDDHERDQRDRRQRAEEVDQRVDEACARRGTSRARSRPARRRACRARRRRRRAASTSRCRAAGGRAASSTNFASTACGVGTSAGLTSPLARTRVPERDDRSHGAAISRRATRRSQGVARLRLQSDERTIDHPFIAQPDAHRPPGKAPPARRLRDRARRGPRAALAGAGAGAHVVRRHARPPGGARPRRGRRRRVRLGRGLVQLPGRAAPSTARAWSRRCSRRSSSAARFASPRAAFDELTRDDRGAGDPVGRARADRAGDRRRRHRAAWTSRARRAGCRCGASARGARGDAATRRGLRERHQPRRAAATRSPRCARRATRAFKLKVGFGAARDVANLAARARRRRRRRAA